MSKLPWPELESRIVDDKIRFTWLTDCHIDSSNTDPQYIALAAAVAYTNIWRPQALVVTGDISNNSLSSLKRAFSVIRLCHQKVIAAIGNHDEAEAELGSPNTADIQVASAFDRNAPFYYNVHLTSGDGSLTALCLVLDNNFYQDDPEDTRDVANHQTGDRIGHHSSMPDGGTYRILTAAQTDWAASILATDNSDIVLVFTHYPPSTVSVTDYNILLDKLQADGRPAILFCGHGHGNASVLTTTSTDSQKTFKFYKAPAMLESGGWVDVMLSLAEGEIVIDQMEIQNFTNPAEWTIATPFTLPE